MIARIAIRPDGKLILGKAFTDGLKPGHVYELRRAVMSDDIIAHDIGPSALGETVSDPDNAGGPVSWCSMPEPIITSGAHLLTREEATP